MQDQDPLIGMEALIAVMERIALAQEQLLAVALEAREERMKLSKVMSDRLKAGFTAEK